MNKLTWNLWRMIVLLGVSLIFCRSCIDKDLTMTIESIDLELQHVGLDSATFIGTVTTNTPTIIDNVGICFISEDDFDPFNDNLPTIYDNDYYRAGEGAGSFTVVISDLKPGKLYHVRGYAHNQRNVIYGEVIPFIAGNPIFTPPCNPKANTVTFNFVERKFGNEVREVNGIDHTIIGSDSPVEMEIRFSDPPKSGIYKIAHRVASLNARTCKIWISLLTDDFYGEEGADVYVERFGLDKYSVTFCEIRFSSRTSSHVEVTSGNLTID